jgi:[ribosomal protein S18]-alanine N-acetyltransferase
MLDMPEPYELRELSVVDVTAVCAIDRLSFPTPAKENLLLYEITENELAHYQCLTAQDVVIGYAGYWLMADEQHISTIATHPDWRRRGLGELLLLNMLSMAYTQPVTMTTLEVRRSNQVAQALYLKYQFEMVGERPRYYRDTNEDAIIMTRAPLNAPYRNWLDAQKNILLPRLKNQVR